MASKKFELFIGAFPGGDVYCNKAVLERGDYKQIAFIDYKGELRLSVDPSYIPGDVLLRIEHDASTKAANFRKEWDKLPDMQKYVRLLDSSGIGGMLYSGLYLKDATLNEKISFFEYIVYGWVPTDKKILDYINNYKNSKYYKGV